MTNNKWYKSSFRRNLIDMHIPDWDPDFFAKIDPKNYVDMLKTANVDTAYIYATSCVGLCNFPTKIGKMHEGLKGRDIIKEITDGCRKEGIRPIIYINMWSKWAYDNHPEWRCLSPEGRESLTYMFEQPGRYGVLCPNSPYKNYVLGLIDELMTMYETDGLWIDMLVWRTTCTCKHCRKRFKDETGHELPMTINMADPVFMQFMHKREVWLCEVFDELKAEVYKYNPNAAVVCNSAYHAPQIMGMSLDFAKKVEYITGDASLGPVRSFEAKLFNNITSNHPFEFLCSVMDPSLEEHSMIKTQDHLLQLMTSCIAHNGRNGFIDAIDPSGTLNKNVYERMRLVYNETDKYIPFLESEIEMCADVAIYTNFSCYFEPEDDGKPLKDGWSSPHLEAAKKAAERLIEQNIAFDVITPLSLSKLNKFKALILPDAFVLSDEETVAIENYVKNGGGLYVSSRCAVYDSNGGKVNEGRLSKMLGVKLCGRTQENLTYIRPCDDGRILPGYNDEHPLSCRTWQSLVEVDNDVNVLCKTTLPWVNPKDITKFASAISDPPGKLTNNPSIVYKEFGKGKIYYSAATLENLSGRDHSALFGRIINDLIGDKPTFLSNAPYPVEIVMYRQKNSKNYIINLTNATLPVLTLADIDVKVKISDNIKNVYFVPDCVAVDYKREGEYISFSIDKMQGFKMIVVETE